MVSDKEILKGLASHKSSVIDHIYREYYPYIESYIFRNNGSEEQAKDTFQDALIIVYKKIEKGDFQLQCKFGTYLYAVCKKIWIQDRKKYIQRLEKLKEYNHLAEPAVEYQKPEENEYRDLMEKHFEKLSPDCQKMLRLFFNDVPMEEISKLMGINSITHTTDKKYRCKKKLIEFIKADPLFRKYSNE